MISLLELTPLLALSGYAGVIASRWLRTARWRPLDEVGDDRSSLTGSLTWAFVLVAVIASLAFLAKWAPLLLTTTPATDTEPAPVNAMAVVTASLGETLLVFLILLAVTAKSRRPRSVLPSRDAAALGLLVGMAAVGVSLLLSIVVQLLGIAEDHTLIALLRSQGTPTLWLLVILSAVVLAPLLEELEYRVVMQTWLGRRLGLAPAIATTAVVFALVHGPAVSIPVLPLGLATGLTYAATHSYVASVAAHMTFNATMLALLAVTV